MSADRRVRWGYHELTDLWAYRLVKGADIRPGDLVVDVGAGHGSITAKLVAAGARVVAIELHPGRAARLRARFGSSILVVQVDLADLRVPRRDFKVLANPPFGITTTLLKRLLNPNTQLRSADLVVPAYVAARWASGRGSAARKWSSSFHVQVAARLPATAFRPPAPMATAVIRIERHGRNAADPHAPPSTTATIDQTGSGSRALGGTGAGRLTSKVG